METNFNLEKHLRENGREIVRDNFMYTLPESGHEILHFLFATLYVRLYKAKSGEVLAMAIYSDPNYKYVRYYGLAFNDPMICFVLFSSLTSLPNIAGIPTYAEDTRFC
jgi:hypothetical protein